MGGFLVAIYLYICAIDGTGQFIASPNECEKGMSLEYEYGEMHKVLYQIRNVSHCINVCKNEESFQCKSIHFDPEHNFCHLHNDTRYIRPDDYVQDQYNLKIYCTVVPPSAKKNAKTVLKGMSLLVL